VSGDVGENERGNPETLAGRCGGLQQSLLDIRTQHILLVVVKVSASTSIGSKLLRRRMAGVGKTT
jgi:hypothetical protein